MSHHVVSLLLTATLIGAGQAHATPASSPTERSAIEEAQVRFHRGIDLYKEGDTAGALAQLTRAYELAPTFKILYNLAQVSCERGEFAAGLRYFRRYLAEGGSDLPPQRRQEVEDEIGALERQAKGSSPGAITPAGSGGGAGTGGDHDRFDDGGRDVNHDGDTHGPEEDGILPLNLPSLKSAAPAVDLKPVPSRDVRQPHRPRQTPWSTWTIAGVMGAAAVVTGVMAMTASADLQTKLNAFPAVPSEVEELRVKERRLSIATDALTVSSLITVAVALYLTFSASTPQGGDDANGRQLAVLKF